MKEFFIQHTEKLVLGLCALVAVWFLYSALTVQQYDKTPQDFEQVISRASQNVRKSEPQLNDLPQLNFQDELVKLKKPVDGAAYKLHNDFIKSIELGYQFRGTPTILSPKEVAVQVNRGLVLLQEKDAKLKGNERAFAKLLAQGYPAELIWFLGNEEMDQELGIVPKQKGPGGNQGKVDAEIRKARQGGAAAGGDGAAQEKRRTSRGVTWVEIVAEFPHADQIREYIKTLKEGAQVAGVRYALAEVQRQELTESLEWTPWTRIAWDKQFDLFNNAEKLDDPYADLPDNVVVPGLVMHAPERAPVGAANAGGGVVQSRRSLVPELPGKEPVWTDEELDPRKPVDENAVPQRKQLPVEEENEEENDPKAPVRNRMGGGNQARGQFANDNTVDTALVRVFDFTAESGKRYRYRVRAVVFNPNYNRPDVLEPDDSMKPFLYGEWSEPSEEIYVEPITEMMLAENKSSQADRAQFTIYHWLAREGRWVSVDLSQYVGQIVGSGTIKPIDVPHYDPKTGKISKIKEQVPGIDTGVTVLDISPPQVRDNIGGADFTIQPPKEAVVVNQFGDLIHLREVDDLANSERVERDTSIREALDNPEAGGVKNNVRDRPRAVNKRAADEPGEGDGELRNPTQ